MKPKFISMFIALVLLFSLFSACAAPLTNPTDSDNSKVPTADTIIHCDDIKVFPKNVIQMGVPFEYYPGYADGHMMCTVTGARVVTEQSEAPPRSWFGPEPILSASDNTHHSYDNWFVEGGAFDKNCRVIVVDVTLTNVDAVAWLNNGVYDENCGYFNDQYTFSATRVIQIADLSRVIYGIGSPRYITTTQNGFSRFGEYSDDVIETTGTETYAVRLLPGETISYSLVFPVNAYALEKKDGSLKSFSIFMACPSAAADSEEDVFIDLKLGTE